MRPGQRWLSLGGLLLILACLDSQGVPNVNTGSGIGPAVNGGGTTSGGGTGSGTNRRVNVGDNFFAPDTVTIATSDTVTWTWTGFNPHSVTFGDGIGSGEKTAGSFSRFFGTAGTYNYTSTVRADSLMRGVVIVQ